jgi:NADPH-dependent glutamate synthase beta subunit-like oxidoreductase
MVDDAINICGLKRFACENSGDIPAPKRLPETGKKIAIVGGGPGGLTAAYYLQLMGHQVTIMERLDKLGGMLRYGIPAYRLPRKYLDEDINHILSTGVQTKFGVSVGKDFTLEELREQYDAVYLSFGAHTSKTLHIKGEEAEGVVAAISMLRDVGYDNPPDYTGKTVVIVGGGNVAMDACRTSVRLGARKVYIAYRRSRADMPALDEEIDGAIAEGCELLELCAPDHVVAGPDGKVKALALRRQIPRPHRRRAVRKPVRCAGRLVRAALRFDYFRHRPGYRMAAVQPAGRPCQPRCHPGRIGWHGHGHRRDFRRRRLRHRPGYADSLHCGRQSSSHQHRCLPGLRT